MFACEKCGCTEFVGHQLCYMDIIVDGDKNFIDSVSEDASADIYEVEDIYGPYTCRNCGAEYDYLL